jgi:hypothetical protein
MKLKDNFPNFKHRPKGENSAKLGTTVFMLKMWLHRVGVDATQTFFFSNFLTFQQNKFRLFLCNVMVTSVCLRNCRTLKNGNFGNEQLQLAQIST